VWVSVTHTEVSSASSWIFLSQVLCTELTTTCCPFNWRTRGAREGSNVRGKQASKRSSSSKGRTRKRSDGGRRRQQQKQSNRQYCTLCVCGCECVGSRFSPPSVSFGRNKKNYSDRRAVSWMDENITPTKSSGLMKTSLWQKSSGLMERWKFYSDKVQRSDGKMKALLWQSPAFSWIDESFTLTKVQPSHGWMKI
jgi:hypothetical protein